MGGNAGSKMVSIYFTIVFTTLSVARACRTLEVSSDELGSIRFSQVTLESLGEALGSGRPSYKSDDREDEIYLYHTESDEPGSGIARWVINHELGAKDAAMAYATSWAILPYFISAVADNEDNKHWMIPSADGSWMIDKSLIISCLEEETTVYVESNPYHQFNAAGFYVRRYVEETNSYQSPLYTHIRWLDTDRRFYLYRMEGESPIWMIGEQYGVDSGVAYVKDPAAEAQGITSTEWSFVSALAHDTWVVDTGRVVCGVCSEEFKALTESGGTIYDVLRLDRGIRELPAGQEYKTLRNQLKMPTIGLGTGGIFREQTYDVISSALDLGYRLLDLAREYGNEHFVAEIFKATHAITHYPKRNDVFLETKVWPTELGFEPTKAAILKSGRALKSNYADLYMLHWPKCNPQIQWMHCETTVDPLGTWQQSWRAMEKAYAEGRILSIGVSNFDVALLDELVSFSLVKPHVVQNWAEPGSVDMPVREWCHKNDVVYQPYASLRNLNRLPGELYSTLEGIANDHHVSVHAAALRFFIQSGAAGIPRSRKNEHLVENLQVMDWQLTEDEMRQLGWYGFADE